MKSLREGKDKIQEICDVLRNETLEPAKKQAEKIVEEAKLKAHQIIQEGEREAEKLMASARHQIDQQKKVFEEALVQASNQSLEALRQKIEYQLFNEELTKLLHKSTADPKVIADLISAIVKGIEKEGIKADIMTLIPQAVSSNQITELLSKGVLERLKEGNIVLSNFSGGVQVKLLEKNMTIDITEETLKEIVARYVRKDFRKFIFGV